MTFLAALVLWLGVVAAPAHAGGSDDFESGIRGGLPELIPWASFAERTDVEVFRCPGGGACESVPLARLASGYGGASLDTSAAVAGDVFEARWSTAGAVIHTARTPAWQGSPTVIRQPSLVGRLVVGATVTLVPGEWAGGWSRPWTTSIGNGVIVCRSPAGTDCFILDPLRPFVLAPRWVGWYAFAFSAFYSGHTNGTPVMGPPPVYPVPLPTILRGATNVDSGPVGRIVASPTAWIRERALRDHGMLRIGRVACSARCRVTLTVSSRERGTLRRTWTVAGTRVLKTALSRGQLKVRVDVDGRRLASGNSVWRR